MDLGPKIHEDEIWFDLVWEEIARFLGQLYNREVTAEDTVTLIRFSAIKPRDEF